MVVLNGTKRCRGQKRGTYVTVSRAMVVESGGMVKIRTQSQVAQRKIYRARQFWMLNPWAGSFAHFPLISSFLFISIMQSISQEGKVPCILFFLTTFQNRTPSNRVPLCCQWYDENPLPPLGRWRISAFGMPLGQLEFLKLHSFCCEYMKTI